MHLLYNHENEYGAHNKILLGVKKTTRWLNCYVISVFLYGSEDWTQMKSRFEDVVQQKEAEYSIDGAGE